MDTLFWKEKWLGDVLLCEKYSRLFRLDSNKDALVSDRIIKDGSSWSLNWQWCREPAGRTGAELSQLQSDLVSFSFANNNKDSWSCTLRGSGIYTTHSFSEILNNLILHNPAPPTVNMRNNLILLKVGVHVWRTKLKRLPVRFELDKRVVDLDTVLCPICNVEVETVEHMTLTCPRVKDLWYRVFKWANVGNSAYNSLEEMFKGLRNSSGPNTSSRIWQAIEWVTGYLIWHNLNLKVFENKEWNCPVMVSDIQSESFLWISSRSKH
ncbi:uncharacterized protein [Rutidosis leptorrhynchoides]|uniref:uncharacterized protein n=1 Tax=Rutidosis leptorrhynchoides TaxID=125765 RepID=UPI003A998D12